MGGIYIFSHIYKTARFLVDESVSLLKGRLV